MGIVQGTNGPDTLVGGGPDTLIGGAGDDTYVINNSDDVIVDSGPFDNTAYTTVSYAIPANASVRTLSTQVHAGTDPLTLIGSRDTLRIIGNYGNNTLVGDNSTFTPTLIGLYGDDIYRVKTGTIIVEAPGQGFDTVYTSDWYYALQPGVSVEMLSALVQSATPPFRGVQLIGNEYDQVIVGDYGSNELNGGGGNDTLIGLRGNDTYTVRGGETIIEVDGEGSDTVRVLSGSYELAAGLSIEALGSANYMSTDYAYFFGNEHAQSISGTYGNNVLDGRGGGDALSGSLGDDSYRVYSSNDLVFEGVDEGSDTVYTSGNYALRAGSEVENISTLNHSGIESINIVGNEFAQQVVGNYGNNLLDGGGAGLLGDTLIGLNGNDTYRVYSNRDTVVEYGGGGNDIIYTSASFALTNAMEIETLSTATHAGTEAIDLSGNFIANTIIGNYGANLLDGRGGADTVYGLEGADTFRFSAPLSRDNIATLADFGNGADTLLLDPGVFTGAATGVLASTAIAIGTAAADADDRLIYNQQTGALFWDADGTGTGAAMQFAVLPTGLSADRLQARIAGSYTATLDSPQADEGDSNSVLYFTVTLDRAATTPFTLDYTTVPGGSTATAGRDYIAVSGSVAFAAGQTSAVIGVTLLADTAYERPETLQMQVTGNSLTASATGTATIIDNDTTATISGGGSFLFGGATGTGTMVASTHPGARVLVFDRSSGDPELKLVFGLESAAPGHPEIQFINEGSRASLDFSQLGQPIVLTPDNGIATASGQLLVPRTVSGIFPVFPIITGTELDDVLDRSDLIRLNGGPQQVATLIGGAGNDILRGGNLQNGGAGNDTLRTVGDGTTMIGGTGSDTFEINVQIRVPRHNNPTNILVDFDPREDRISLIDNLTAYPDALQPGALSANQFHVGRGPETPSQVLNYDPDTGYLTFRPLGSNGGLSSAFTTIIAQLPTQLDLGAENFTVIAP